MGKYVGSVTYRNKEVKVFHSDSGGLEYKDKNGKDLDPKFITEGLNKRVLALLNSDAATKPVISDDEPLAQQLINMGEQAKHGAYTDLGSITLGSNKFDVRKTSSGKVELISENGDVYPYSSVSNNWKGEVDRFVQQKTNEIGSNDVKSKTAAAFAATRPPIQQAKSEYDWKKAPVVTRFKYSDNSDRTKDREDYTLTLENGDYVIRDKDGVVREPYTMHPKFVMDLFEHANIKHEDYLNGKYYKKPITTTPEKEFNPGDVVSDIINPKPELKQTDDEGYGLAIEDEMRRKISAGFAATKPIGVKYPYTGDPKVDSKLMDQRIKNRQFWKGYIRDAINPDVPTPLKQNAEILQEPEIEKQFDLKESMKTEVEQQKIEEEQQKIEDATNAENFEKIKEATESILGIKDETDGKSTSINKTDKIEESGNPKPKKFFGMEHPVRSLLGVAFGAALATGANMLFSGGKKTAGGGSPVASASSDAGSEGGKQPPPKDDKEDGGMSAIMSAMEKAYANIQVPEAYKNASREYNDMFKMTPDNARMRQTSAVDEAAMKVHEIYGNTVTSFYDQLLAGLGKSNGEKSAKLLESNSKLRSDVASLMENSAKIAISLSVPMGSKDYVEALKLRAEGARGIMEIMSPGTWDKMSVAALKAADGIVEVAKYNAQMGMAKVNASIAANKNTVDYKNKQIQYKAAEAKMTSSKELAKKIPDEKDRATEQARIDQVYMDDLRNIENNSFAKLY